MTDLTLTSDEAARLDDGSVTLYRPGESERCSGCDISPRVHRHHGPPAEFTEAARRCDLPSVSSRRGEHICSDCIDGKRRITARKPAMPGPGIYGSTTSGTITVATVVVEGGPLEVLADDSEAGIDPCVYYSSTSPVAPIWWMKATPDGWHVPLWVPPDVDPYTLIGQFALHVRKVEL